MFDGMTALGVVIFWSDCIIIQHPVQLVNGTCAKQVFNIITVLYIYTHHIHLLMFPPPPPQPDQSAVHQQHSVPAHRKSLLWKWYILIQVSIIVPSTNNPITIYIQSDFSKMAHKCMVCPLSYGT